MKDDLFTVLERLENGELPSSDDGFIILQHVNNASEPKKKKKSKKKEKSAKVKKSKKGSVKAWLTRLVKRAAPSRMVENFHDKRLENIVIYDKDDKPHVVKYKGKISKSLFKKLRKKYPDAYVLIDGGDGFYSRISVETYEIVCGMNRIAVHYELSAMCEEWDEEERDIITPIDRIFDSVNELVRFHMSERTRVDTIDDMCCRDFWYDMYLPKYRIMVEYKDGTLEYYKDINEFFDDIGMSLI